MQLIIPKFYLQSRSKKLALLSEKMSFCKIEQMANLTKSHGNMMG